jgi:PKD repeat protein
MSWKVSIAASSAAAFILIASPRTITVVLAQNEGGASPAATRSPMMLPKIPQLQLQPIPGYGPAPLTVGFLASSSDPEAPFETYRWNFGDGQVSTLPPIALFHTYKNPGSYVVSVTATTTEGHQASGFAGIIVTQPAQ